MDVSNTLYLIDKNGDILWRKQLGGPVLGNFKQIDFYKNAKLQLVFNTRDSVYIIDREGNFVEDYPHAVPSKATAPMAVFDYENNKDYRFLIPTANRRIFNYDKNWKQVKGWRFNKTQHKVERIPQHFLLKATDYITLIDNKGKIYILDRRGRSKIRNLNQNFRVTRNSMLYAKKTKDGKHVFVCSATDGNVYFIDPANGKTGKILSTKDFRKGHYFFYTDYNLDGENDYVFIDKNKVKVINHNKKDIFEWKSEDQTISSPVCYEIQNLHTRLGIVLEKEEEVYFFGTDGKPLKGIPFDGDKIHITDNEYPGAIVSNNKEIIIYQVNE
jgi:DNA-binding beta-propeller fold protein YncE